MESWRSELYQTLSHSIEGSTWKDHKYVAIVNGKYIYPEDLKNGGSASKSGIISGAVKTIKGSESSSTAASASSNASGSAQSSSSESTAQNPKNIKYNDKGKVKSYRHLPKDPEIGDVYYLEDTKQKVYWNGEIWTPYAEKKKKGGGKGGGGDKDSGDPGTYTGLKPETVTRIRSVLSADNFAKKNKGLK